MSSATYKKETQILKRAPDGDIHVIPIGNGQKTHEESSKCWCEPHLDNDYGPVGGKKVWVHRELQ